MYCWVVGVPGAGAGDGDKTEAVNRQERIPIASASPRAAGRDKGGSVIVVVISR